MCFAIAPIAKLRCVFLANEVAMVLNALDALIISAYLFCLEKNTNHKNRHSPLCCLFKNRVNRPIFLFVKMVAFWAMLWYTHSINMLIRNYTNETHMDHSFSDNYLPRHWPWCFGESALQRHPRRHNHLFERKHLVLLRQ